jgi:hypothetical protein
MKNPFISIMKNKTDKELFEVLEKKEDYHLDAIKATKEEIEKRGGIEVLKKRCQKSDMGNDWSGHNLNNSFIECKFCHNVQSSNNTYCSRCSSEMDEKNKMKVRWGYWILAFILISIVLVIFGKSGY